MAMGTTQALRVASKIPLSRIREFVALAEVLKGGQESPVYELAVDGMGIIVHDQNARYISESIKIELAQIPKMWAEISKGTDYTKKEIREYCREPISVGENQLDTEQVSVDENDPIPDDKKIEIGSQLKDHPLFPEFKQRADRKYDDSDEGLAELVDDAMVMILNDLTTEEMRSNLFIIYIYTHRIKQFSQEKTKVEFDNLRDFEEEYIEAINSLQ